MQIDAPFARGLGILNCCNQIGLKTPHRRVCLTVATPSDSTVCKIKSESADKCETRERVGIRLSIALAKS